MILCIPGSSLVSGVELDVLSSFVSSLILLSDRVKLSKNIMLAARLSMIGVCVLFLLVSTSIGVLGGSSK